MSQSAYNQVIASTSFTAGTAYTVEVPLYHERIIVTNESTTADLYVATNGSAAATTEGNFGAVVVPGAWRMVGNDQSRQPLVSIHAPGSTVQNTGYQGATDVNLYEPASGYPTYVSLLFPTGSTPGAVSLEFV
jgi:hypothetical protein